MKRHLNTLYVTTPKAWLAKEGETVVVRVEKETRLQVPIHTLGAIACFGEVLVSPHLLGLCGQRGVTVTFFSRRGRFLARVEGPTSGNVLLRREQYRRADAEPGALEIARSIVIAKVANCRTALRRAAREHGDAAPEDPISKAANGLTALLTEAQRAPSLDGVRGLEGAAARVYFSVFDQLIRQQKADFFFTRRSRRPPLDLVNGLLSFLYTILLSDARGALEGVGLDPAVGFLHRDRPGRPSLALDVMEELRPFLADRLALSLINLRQIKASDFTSAPTGGVWLTEEGRKTVLVAYQKRKQEEIEHPFLGEKTTVGLIPHVQALLLARHLRGDLDGYPPFVQK